MKAEKIQKVIKENFPTLQEILERYVEDKRMLAVWVEIDGINQYSDADDIIDRLNESLYRDGVDEKIIECIMGNSGEIGEYFAKTKYSLCLSLSEFRDLPLLAIVWKVKRLPKNPTKMMSHEYELDVVGSIIDAYDKSEYGGKDFVNWAKNSVKKCFVTPDEVCRSRMIELVMHNDYDVIKPLQDKNIGFIVMDRDYSSLKTSYSRIAEGMTTMLRYNATEWESLYSSHPDMANAVIQYKIGNHLIQIGMFHYKTRTEIGWYREGSAVKVTPYVIVPPYISDDQMMRIISELCDENLDIDTVFDVDGNIKKFDDVDEFIDFIKRSKEKEED